MVQDTVYYPQRAGRLDALSRLHSEFFAKETPEKLYNEFQRLCWQQPDLLNLEKVFG